MVSLLVFFGVIAVISTSAVLNGIAIKLLWGWFMIPIFAVEAISIPEAIGLGMFAGFMTWQYNKSNNEKESNADKISTVLMMFIRPLLAIVVGWIVSQFV